ncbi:MAG: L-threonate dehydrogenase [Lentilitoribacter sp.]
MPSHQTAAVFGLGAMGYGMASSLLRSGITTYGFDVVTEQMEKFQSDGGQKGSIKDATAEISIAVVCVLNAEQTEDVMFGKNSIVAQMKQGSVVIACATVPPEFAKDMEKRCGAHGIAYLDAPISGGSAKAASGDLSIMASGTPEAFEIAKPALDACAQTVFELGDAAGAGSAMKAVNQLLAGVHIATMAEALTFGMTQGVTPEKFIEVISQCAGSSWMLENRAPHIADGDYTPLSQINIWPKDLGIVLDVAKKAGFSAPITSTALQQYMVAVGMGLGREDDAAIAKVYARNVGLKLPGETQ